MADIFHDLRIAAPPSDVFRAVSTPGGLDAWWTKSSRGQPAEGQEYELWFGPDYDWRAQVTRCVPDSEFELEITRADQDWTGTRVGFHLSGQDEVTLVRFHHTGWPTPNEHWRVSSYCWAMYLRVLRVHLERGDVVPYERRLEA